MLTPRRTMLLLAGFMLSAGAYFAYAQLLGWLDGLPQLPAKMLVPADPGSFVPPERSTSQTLHKLVVAFGENSPETNYSHYETQIEIRNGESSIVVAAGKAPSNPNSKRVTLSPFSIAIFSKERREHLRQPGEVTEITTIHADKGVLEFDRVITNPADMRPGKATLVQLELHSDFAEALPDPRRGTIHITNNQRSSDPNRALVLRTVGPMFYRDPKAVAGTPAANGPDFWTDAAVEIVDRQNLPRPVGSAAPVAVPTRSEENRHSGAVAAILSGQRLPPPTITALGLRVYLEQKQATGQPKPAPKPGASPMNGVRRVEFLEQVVMNLWVDNGQSIVGGTPAPGQPPPPKNSGLALVPPPPAIAAVTGGLGPIGYNARLLNRALLQIDTRGPFSYDAEKALARFDVVPHSDPNLPNDVQVTKIPAHGGASSLYSQVLELEFNGGPTGAARPSNAPAIKQLHAWTQVPNGYITLASDDNSVVAYGRDLVHQQAESRTRLSGTPLRVVQGRSELSAGTPQEPATLIIEPGPPPQAGPGQPAVRKQQMTVRGAGKIEMRDPGTNAVTFSASWRTSLLQSRDLIDGREQDVFVLTDNAKFDDRKADYWLTGNVLKVWMEPRADKAAGAPELSSPTGGAKPSRVLAVGNVKSHSAEYDITYADQLTVHITDAKPVVVTRAVAPPTKDPAPAPQPGPTPLATPVPPKPPEPAAKAPEKPKPPHQISAKSIEMHLTRFTAPSPAGPKPKEPAAESVRYQLNHARCEEAVNVHQDPTDPSKSRGVDILGRLLLIDGSADGSVMTVYGWPNRLGEVHQEEMSLLGPEVVLNQVRNSASVTGRGALTMPTNSDLAGGELRQPEVVVIHWRDKMTFDGAKRSAQFVGKVQATQGESSVNCHTMNVVFDRPMYFNTAQKQAAAREGNTSKAKLDKVFCYPAPGDTADVERDLEVRFNQVEHDKDGKPIKVQQLSASELRMFAQAQEPGSKETFQRIIAEGPGRVRIWQQGEANPVGPAGGAAPQPMQPVPKNDQEMKLTIVEFSGRMTAVEKGKVYREATFGDNVKAVSVPAKSPTLAVNMNNPPDRAVLMTCSKKMVVWSHKKQNAALEQVMEAVGNAYVQSDDYDGSAETIKTHGKAVDLIGSATIPARVMSRGGQGTEKTGKIISYDRSTGSVNIVEGFGGRINPNK
ncbi:hypothetical protein GobsT_49120 [Gemmata obscuriglobus]|uniref:Organic solvent tolerance-like N-terminal domain-containing protein n=1 Tax=Gemmata obscuriglobus TaxID=114 RepID=A0A2Z3H680_9BACT|nr:hypothetical protein [Gemmata obscuriglobus]AWM37154.1 hypothetical protein C1280_09055 [Gemmata obscuriglobus]QEG30112.1 hypothetical protein GobsT_49120 [Gemmata obscuriglobus]VTS09433.1 Uncharacterized protein OS=Planctomyces limnophilus (strain ATCC 43296 / DSM 3776 / IFAM 1008 / 290) GN=Plim_3739 PE=4 SV=1 [Gemmata obscuriglobus UQM 2246]